MPSKNNFSIPLDKFIDLALYDKKIGYYMKKSPFGKDGDFVTAPNISRLFSEVFIRSFDFSLEYNIAAFERVLNSYWVSMLKLVFKNVESCRYKLKPIVKERGVLNK